MTNRMSLKFIWVCVFVTIACFFTGCHPGVKKGITQFSSLKKLKHSTYPEFKDTLDFQGLRSSIDKSLLYFNKVPLKQKYNYGKQIYTAGHMILSLETMKAFLEKKPSVKALNAFIKSRFIVYEAAGNEDGKVLFTGYFEPVFDGRMEKSPEFAVPIYSRPQDLLEIALVSPRGKYFNGANTMLGLDVRDSVTIYFS